MLQGLVASATLILKQQLHSWLSAVCVWSCVMLCWDAQLSNRGWGSFLLSAPAVYIVIELGGGVVLFGFGFGLDLLALKVLISRNF